MKHSTFLLFTLPSLSVMFLFIAIPIVSVFIQSLHIEHKQVIIVTENCDPFGCETTTSVDTEASAKLKEKAPLGKFNGFKTYSNRMHFAFDEVGEAWKSSDSFTVFVKKLYNYPLYRALSFTLTYTFIVTPFVLFLGFLVAVGVNNLPKMFKGPTIFASLLPMIVTPLVGSLILFWMVDGDGVIGATLQKIFNDNSLSLKASPVLTWIMLMVYGIWHLMPFSFIVFYAGLQTVPQETIEAATIDGASKFQRIRHVVIPHLMPLAIFITLILLMDNFRVFEPIIGFKAEAHATSISWLIWNHLRESAYPLYNAAGATSMITIFGVAILLLPVLIRTWRDFKEKNKG